MLANRLSASGRHRVVLIEAGKDYPPGREPEALLHSYSGSANYDPRFLWNEMKALVPAPAGNEPGRSPLRKYEQGRVTGGTSSVNGMMANRGSPQDYDDWQDKGAAGWSWDDVLPYFKKLENDQDFDGPAHGKDGPMPIRRLFPEIWPGFLTAVKDGCGELGLDYTEDQNGYTEREFEDGFFPFPITNLYDRRVSAAVAYLTPTVRHRPNLEIMDETQVERLTIEGTRVTGAIVQRHNARRTIEAGRVIVSAGALNGPALLMRSGIGPAAHLREKGIDVVADRPGIGQHLMEHPNIALAAWIKPENRLPEDMGRNLIAGGRYSSGYEGCPPGDMFLLPNMRTAWHAFGRRIGAMIVWINRSYSTGTVQLADADWRSPPDVDFNMLSDRRDLERLMDGMRFLVRLSETPMVNGAADEFFAASFTDKVRKAGAVTTSNRVKSAVAAKMMDAMPPFRKMMIRSMITDAPPIPDLLADDTVLEAYVRKAVGGTWHASCTCRMGRPDDPLAVTDPTGGVYGVDGLTVCDASIMPHVPSANTNLPTLMMAEKIADGLIANA